MEEHVPGPNPRIVMRLEPGSGGGGMDDHRGEDDAGDQRAHRCSAAKAGRDLERPDEFGC